MFKKPKCVCVCVCVCVYIYTLLTQTRAVTPPLDREDAPRQSLNCLNNNQNLVMSPRGAQRQD
jgi:hypothetical protein